MELTSAQYVEVFSADGGLSENQRQLLTLLFNAPGRRATASMLSASTGHRKSGPANSILGNIGKKVAEHFDLPRPLVGRAFPGWWKYVANGESTARGFVFEMKTPVAEALIRLAIVEDQASDLIQHPLKDDEELREELRFKFDERTVGRARVDRSSEAVAEVVIETLLADAPAAGRRAVLQFLADSMAYVMASQPERWGVTLEPGHVRFNAGQTEAVVLWSGEVQVLVADTTQIAGTTTGDLYPSAGGARLRSVPFEIAAKVLPGLRATHELAMLSAVRRPSTRVIKEAHSPGVVKFLWDTLGIDGVPPVPTYFVVDRQPRPAAGRIRGPLSDEAIMALPDLSLTEKTAVIKQRLAQSLFRRRLSATQRSCRVTGISDCVHLRASHVKPWRDCSSVERQDPNNGLLLAPHVDHLFDQGYLSFEDNGTVLVSRHLDRAVLEAWGLEGVKKVTPFSVKQAKYLAHHRKHVFERRKD